MGRELHMERLVRPREGASVFRWFMCWIVLMREGIASSTQEAGSIAEIDPNVLPFNSRKVGKGKRCDREQIGIHRIDRN